MALEQESEPNCPRIMPIDTDSPIFDITAKKGLLMRYGQRIDSESETSPPSLLLDSESGTAHNEENNPYDAFLANYRASGSFSRNLSMRLRQGAAKVMPIDIFEENDHQ